MIISTIPASNCTPQTIVIGRRGTYDTMQIAFDLSYLIENYGSGTAVLAIKRSQDESAYPAVVTQEDATLLWTVNETDTAYVGSGECQLMWYVDGGLAKTIIYPIVVMKDILSTAETPPDGYENWIEHLTDLGVETLRNAQNAAQSASDAETAKDDSVTAKEASEAAQKAAEEAQEKAEIAVSHYPVIINGYWNVWSVEAQTYVSTGIKAEGEDGYSPEVTITAITGGHRVTITDEDHPQGQSFDVLDGQSGTTDYTDLDNKPSINGHTLDGDQTAEQLGLATPSDIPDDAGDIGYDAIETYESGTVGGGLNNLSRHLSDLADTVSTTQIINTASGAIASFNDGADGQPIRKLVANIEPVQDLNGYANPWPAGGGVNIADPSKMYLFSNNTYIASNNYSTQGAFDVDENTEYSFSCLNQSGDGRIIFWDANGTEMSRVQILPFTTPSGCKKISFYRSMSQAVSSVEDAKVMICKGSTATYSPYSNICPISGHTGAEIEQTGKNRIHVIAGTRTQQGVVWVIDDDGTIHTTGRTTGPSYSPNIENVKIASGTYTISIISDNANVALTVYADGTWLREISAGSSFTFTRTANTVISGFVKINSSDVDATGTTYIMLEKGATATSYEPYVSNQISVTFPDEAGTVYGGTLDVTNRVLTVTNTLITLNGSESIDHNGGMPYGGIQVVYTPSTEKANGYPDSYSDLLSNIFSTTINYAEPFFINGRTTNGKIYFNMPETVTTIQQAMDWFSANNTQVWYKLANPITYQLTESEISGILETLYGTNNIWADTGDTEVTYPCDTRLFIEGKIAEAIAALQS